MYENIYKQLFFNFLYTKAAVLVFLVYFDKLKTYNDKMYTLDTAGIC